MTRAKAICDRCGWKYNYTDMRLEDSNLFVCPTCDDGPYSQKSHPQNHIRVTRDHEALKYARPDVVNVTASVSWHPGLSAYGPYIAP